MTLKKKNSSIEVDGGGLRYCSKSLLITNYPDTIVANFHKDITAIMNSNVFHEQAGRA
jgi:hypothetical protein